MKKSDERNVTVKMSVPLSTEFLRDILTSAWEAPVNPNCKDPMMAIFDNASESMRADFKAACENTYLQGKAPLTESELQSIEAAIEEEQPKTTDDYSRVIKAAIQTARPNLKP